MADFCQMFCKPFIGCFSCLCCDCLCCECNCIIFPAPRSPFLIEDSPISEGLVATAFYKFAANGRSIPYAEISTVKSRASNKCFIFFHGNAEDISMVANFLEPIVEEINITFYSIQYPTYSSYQSTCPAFISNKIKEDALAFYDYLLRVNRTVSDIYVMGRSIGSGGASYLAGNRKVPLLILMSPFDTLKKVSASKVGCLGNIIKQHFNNSQQIVKFNGKLLVIHGSDDQVIEVQHGKALVRTYQQNNLYRNKAMAVFPTLMTHNSFDLDADIIKPIVRFIKSSSEN